MSANSVLLHDGWRGIADFLVRIDTPSPLWPWSYEAWDTKLARQGRPYFALQLSFYSEQLARLQRLEPEWMHVVLGTQEQLSLRCADYAAYYRTVKRRFLWAVAEGRDTYPYPVPHCALCDFKEKCEQRWETDDALCLVAGIRREQTVRLQEAGVSTVAELGATGADLRVRIGPPTLLSLQRQAALQTHHRLTGGHTYELISPGPDPGFALLPEPTDDDLFFDMEGYPYFEPGNGLEYLFGVLWVEPSRPKFLALWAEDHHAERKAFEDFVDLALARLARNPGLHIYHYAHYEPTELKRLMCLHRTREDLGGHLKTGHRSTLQNRPPRAERPRRSDGDRHPTFLVLPFSLCNTRTWARLWECGNLAFWARFPSRCGNRSVVSIETSFPSPSSWCPR
jgi:predicted RecB family nuclease